MSIDTEGFRQRIRRAFPPAPFYGLISTHDECDEGIALRRELPGKRWDEIPAAFVDFNSGSLPLLEPMALVAFLPAWLQRSVETVSGPSPSVLAEFTMYFLCPGSEDDEWQEKRTAECVTLFDPTQRSVIGDFLRLIAENDEEDQEGWRPYVERGLKWWVGGGGSGGSEPK